MLLKLRKPQIELFSVTNYGEREEVHFESRSPVLHFYLALIGDWRVGSLSIGVPGV